MWDADKRVFKRNAELETCILEKKNVISIYKNLIFYLKPTEKEQQLYLPENRGRLKITVEISGLENRKAIEKPVKGKAARSILINIQLTDQDEKGTSYHNTCERTSLLTLEKLQDVKEI